jgi:hypothetical protein
MKIGFIGFIGLQKNPIFKSGCLICRDVKGAHVVEVLDAYVKWLGVNEY